MSVEEKRQAAKKFVELAAQWEEVYPLYEKYRDEVEKIENELKDLCPIMTGIKFNSSGHFAPFEWDVVEEMAKAMLPHDS